MIRIKVSISQTNPLCQRDLVQSVFAFTHPEEMFRLAPVSKLWNSLAETPNFHPVLATALLNGDDDYMFYWNIGWGMIRIINGASDKRFRSVARLVETIDQERASTMPIPFELSMFPRFRFLSIDQVPTPQQEAFFRSALLRAEGLTLRNFTDDTILQNYDIPNVRLLAILRKFYDLVEGFPIESDVDWVEGFPKVQILITEATESSFPNLHGRIKILVFVITHEETFQLSNASSFTGVKMLIINFYAANYPDEGLWQEFVSSCEENEIERIIVSLGSEDLPAFAEKFQSSDIVEGISNHDAPGNAELLRLLEEVD